MNRMNLFMNGEIQAITGPFNKIEHAIFIYYEEAKNFFINWNFSFKAIVLMADQYIIINQNESGVPWTSDGLVEVAAWQAVDGRFNSLWFQGISPNCFQSLDRARDIYLLSQKYLYNE